MTSPHNARIARSAKAGRPVRSRRSRSQLEAAIVQAASRRDKALARYRLGLFHDNNSREAEASPHYLSAIALGLPPGIKAQALAWLASSFYKIGLPNRALTNIRKSLVLTSDPHLRQFLERLERRV